jgi:hypothetical protein
MLTIVEVLKLAKVGTPPAAAGARSKVWQGDRTQHKLGRVRLTAARKADREPGPCIVRKPGADGA